MADEVSSPPSMTDTVVESEENLSVHSGDSKAVLEPCCLHGPELYASLRSLEVRHENRKLSDIFQEGMNLYDHVSNSDAPTNSVETQAKVKRAMNLFEEATKLVSAADIFSRNESVEEISTKNIKYLLLPALLGTLVMKLCVDDRMEVVKTADVYFRDFLQRCKDYSVSDFEMPEREEEIAAEQENSHSPEHYTRPSFDLVTMARERNAKIQRFKEQKELEADIKQQKKFMSLPDVSEEDERKYYLSLIKLYINQSFDEIQSLRMEKPLLAHMSKVRKEAPFATQERREKLKKYERKPLTPIIITRDEVQKKVFGAGYPSLPTMTVAEFYDHKVKVGDFPDPTKPSMRNALQDRAPTGALQDLTDPSEEEKVDKEQKEETDDPESLQRAREWDEWKDDHRRGWGNRMNRS